MKKLRVLIVEDSPTVRVLLEHIVGSDPRLEVVGSVTSAEAMLDRLDALAPDVISMDVRLPGLNGLDATLEVMRRRPTPIVIVAADVDAPDLGIAMNALRAGALAVVEKPVGIGHAAYQAIAERLCNQLVLMSQVKLVRQAPYRALDFGSGRYSAADMPLIEPSAPVKIGPAEGPPYEALGIAASTGGPKALVQLLNQLGPDFPLPVLLVQHILGPFLPGFVQWLASVTPFQAAIAAHEEEPRAGVVYVPPAGHHLLWGGGRLLLSDAGPVGGQRPSGTVLMRSLASLGERAIGVILTGMGSDGAAGLFELRRAGGYTIAEDASTAVVYGMPAAARRIGAVRELLPLDRIGPRIRDLVTGRTENAKA